MSLVSELRRRNVFRVAIAYAVVAWLVAQVAELALDSFGSPDWVMKTLLLLIVLGVIPALVFAWVFELTPEGLKRESDVAEGASVVHQTRRKLDTLIIVTLVLAVGYLIWDGQIRDGDSSTTAGPVDSATHAAGEGAGASAAAGAPDTETVGNQDKSIAVLPFVNLSSDPEQEYFSDGISEELLNVLAQIPELRVAARTSSFQFKGDNRDISEIADLLKVNHVLEGSVRKAGTRLRITAQLIEAEDGYHLWSDTYDRELEDVFAIQDEISRAIADALRAQLALDDLEAPAASKATANTPAYEAFLKGRGLINQRGNQAITAGVNELERAVRLDPNYAPARAQLAIGIALLTASSGSYGDLSLDEVNERAGEQIAAAAALDDDFAELWAARAVLASVSGNAQGSLENAEKALAIRPNYADPLNWRINALAELGRMKAAEQAREELLELDPLSVIGRLNAVTSMANREPERAMAVARSIAPQSPWASHVAQSRVYRSKGEKDRELEQLLFAYALDANDLLVNFDLQAIFSHVGLYEESLRISRETRPWALLGAGQFAEAEQALRVALAADPESLEVMSSLAESVYHQGRYAEAIEIWRGALVDTEHGEAVYSNGGNLPTAQFTYALQQSGDDSAASAYLQALAALEAALNYAGIENRGWLGGQALIAMLEDDSAGAVEWLQSAVAAGLDDLTLFDEPILGSLRDTPEFRVLRETVGNRREEQRAAVLGLICENNPAPEHWRPLEATCVGS